ncbi:MAG: TolC family protein [Chitinophagaceae bacterium]|nr:TolC family protein [Chitinophagaceae bacterium]
MKIIFSFIFSILLYSNTFCQDKWNLKRCVEYAMANNISIKQTGLQATLAELQYKQSKLSQYPDFLFGASGSFNSGRQQNPTSFELVTQNNIIATTQLQSSVDIFNWYRKRNSIAANLWELEAAKAGTDKLKSDIALTIANAYLQILLAKEQAEISLVQLKQSQQQLFNTRKLVEAGNLPELNAAELEAQVARDSSTYISAKGNIELSILSLKANMNIDAAAPFEIEIPPVENIPVESLADLQPEAVYVSAIANLPQQRVNDFKLKAAEKNAAAVKATLYPTLSAFGSLNSSYIYLRRPVFAQNLVSFQNTGLKVDIGGGVLKDVQSPVFQQGNRIDYFYTDAFGNQIVDNLRKSVGLNLNVPIFSGGNLRTNWERSKINIQTLELQKEQDNQKIKQDIYQAYNSAVVALEKFNAGKKALSTAERTYSFAQKRFDVGMLPTLDLITNQNNLFRAKLENTLNQFDYVFKMKVLEFYKGQGLKL